MWSVFFLLRFFDIPSMQAFCKSSIKASVGKEYNFGMAKKVLTMRFRSRRSREVFTHSNNMNALLTSPVP